jgi:hypothetical protein
MPTYITCFMYAYVCIVQATAKLLYAVVKSTVRSTFHKLNVHTALQPSDILNFFKQVIEQAKELKSAYESHSASRVPFVTVS